MTVLYHQPLHGRGRVPLQPHRIMDHGKIIAMGTLTNCGDNRRALDVIGHQGGGRERRGSR